MGDRWGEQPRRPAHGPPWRDAAADQGPGPRSAAEAADMAADRRARRHRPAADATCVRASPRGQGRACGVQRCRAPSRERAGSDPAVGGTDECTASDLEGQDPGHQGVRRRGRGPRREGARLHEFRRAGQETRGGLRGSGRAADGGNTRGEAAGSGRSLPVGSLGAGVRGQPGCRRNGAQPHGGQPGRLPRPGLGASQPLAGRGSCIPNRSDALRERHLPRRSQDGRRVRADHPRDQVRARRERGWGRRAGRTRSRPVRAAREVARGTVAGHCDARRRREWGGAGLTDPSRTRRSGADRSPDRLCGHRQWRSGWAFGGGHSGAREGALGANGSSVQGGQLVAAGAELPVGAEWRRLHLHLPRLRVPRGLQPCSEPALFR